MINVFQPALGQEELDAIQAVFAANWVGRGPQLAQFEASFAAHIGVAADLMQSVNSCTEGLFQAMNLLQLGQGDEVVMPAISFVGAANAVAACGGRPVFCDVDPRSLNPTAAHIEKVLTAKTKAVVLLHYGGVPCAMDGICDLLTSRKIPLIEDCAISVASRYKGQACGAFGAIGVWSFDAMKILVTGDGGMLYCRDPELAQQASKLLYLGLETSSGLSSQALERWWEFEVACPGRQAGMNDLTAAIGTVQLAKLPTFIARRRAIAERYDAALAVLPWLRLPPAIPADVQSSYYFYWVQLGASQRDALARYLRSQGIYSTFRYYPLHKVRSFAAGSHLPNAEQAAEETLCLPLHSSLTDEDVATVATMIADFAKGL